MSFLSKIFGSKKVETIIPNFPLLFKDCKIDSDKIDSVILEIKKFYIPNKNRYIEASKLCSVPAWLIFCIHYKEASCSFKGALHNGDLVIGNGKKTVNVPKGRGPFKTWEESAIDALMMKKNIFPMNWSSIPSCLEFAERYNGLGHRYHGKLSPYVWAYTNQSDELGNYSSDGNYDYNQKVKSAGVAALLLGLYLLSEIDITEDRLFIK